MDRLEKYMARFGKVAIAFSAGVDSTLLAYVATKVLGQNAFVFTIKTPYIPDWEIKNAIDIGDRYNFNFKIIELDIPKSISSNPTDRCYLCKSVIFNEIISLARAENINVIFDGSNIDDTKEIRPGMRALRELNVRSPFIELGYNKSEIRKLSKELALPTWNTPSNACLLTRIPYNFRISPELINRIANAEKILKKYGYGDVRVRHHEEIARIEIPVAAIPGFISDVNKESIILQIKGLGYKFVTLDLDGYKTGSMGNGVNQ